MALSAKYHHFLSAPSAELLSDQASINYITTLTTITKPAAIVKHLAAQAKIFTKKDEKLLNAIENSNALCLEVETTLEFITGGGAFLPGLDDNFISDRTVIFPVVHIVQFDDQQKIRTIRLHWDQASLLKQVDVIGSRARNWPIRDGKDQARLIASSTSSAQSSSAALPHKNNSAREVSEGDESIRPQTGKSSISATGDPHASLSLFQPRDINQESYGTPTTSSVQRAKSAKPPSRNLTDILGEEDEPGSVKSPPSKDSDIRPRAGAAKNYHPIRLFDKDDADVETPGQSPERKKVNPKKFEHFHFGDGEEAPEPNLETARSKTKKHASQWAFEDFATPEKVRSKVQPQNTRHFGWSDDEDAEDSPVKRPVVHQPRPSAQAQFELRDDDTPTAERTIDASSRGRQHNKGLGLYKDPLLEGEDDEQIGKSAPPSKATKTVNNQSRHKHFDSQFEMTDASPGSARMGNPVTGNATLPETKKKVLKGLDANWDLYEQSPERSTSMKENLPKGPVKERGINIDGDGMGGRKGSARDWFFGDDTPENRDPGASRNHNGKVDNQPTKGGFWDF